MRDTPPILFPHPQLKLITIRIQNLGLQSQEAQHVYKMLNEDPPHDQLNQKRRIETWIFFIPVDFCIEFWNSTFSSILEYTEEIFLIA